MGYAYGSAPFERAAFRWVAEDSVYLAPEAQGRGIGRKLCEALEKILKYLGYRKIYAIITTENTHSLDFHRKMGYSFLAEFPDCGWKFGRLLGVTWLDKDLEIVELPSNFPIDWQIVVQDSQRFSEIFGILSLS